mmetsp:Transcript_30439/g.86818  ORF Transcript_30439/g.86818 Transcript_30439/m.86818 type:complete len:303 (-) Transcript_30439:720-1628(-)
MAAEAADAARRGVETPRHGPSDARASQGRQGEQADYARRTGPRHWDLRSLAGQRQREAVPALPGIVVYLVHHSAERPDGLLPFERLREHDLARVKWEPQALRDDHPEPDAAPAVPGPRFGSALRPHSSHPIGHWDRPVKRQAQLGRLLRVLAHRYELPLFQLRLVDASDGTRTHARVHREFAGLGWHIAPRVRVEQLRGHAHALGDIARALHPIASAPQCEGLREIDPEDRVRPSAWIEDRTPPGAVAVAPMHQSAHEPLLRIPVAELQVRVRVEVDVDRGDVQRVVVLDDRDALRDERDLG